MRRVVSPFLAALFLTGVVLATQAQTPRQMQETGLAPAPFQPDLSDNAYRLSPFLPADVRRVAVLPLTGGTPDGDLPAACEILQPVLLAELMKTKKFEAVLVDPETLQHLTGRMSWTGAEVLPADFFDSLRETYDCDAVLFCELTVFRAYPPLAVGWRMQLVQARTHQVLWAVDEVFDAGQRQIAGESRRYLKPWWQFLPGTAGTEDAWIMSQSPRHFGEYAASKALATLPERQKRIKVLR